MEATPKNTILHVAKLMATLGKFAEVTILPFGFSSILFQAMVSAENAINKPRLHSFFDTRSDIDIAEVYKIAREMRSLSAEMCQMIEELDKLTEEARRNG